MKIFANPLVWVGIIGMSAIFAGGIIWNMTSSQRCSLNNALLCESFMNVISPSNTSIKGSYTHLDREEIVSEVVWYIDKEGNELIRTSDGKGGDIDIIIAGETTYLSKRTESGYWKVNTKDLGTYTSSFPFYPTQWVETTLVPLREEGRLISQNTSRCGYGKCIIYKVNSPQSKEMIVEVDERMKMVRNISYQSDTSVYKVTMNQDASATIIPRREIAPAKPGSTVISDFFLRRDVKESKTPAYVRELEQQRIQFEQAK